MKRKEGKKLGKKEIGKEGRKQASLKNEGRRLGKKEVRKEKKRKE